MRKGSCLRAVGVRRRVVSSRWDDRGRRGLEMGDAVVKEKLRYIFLFLTASVWVDLTGVVNWVQGSEPDGLVSGPISCRNLVRTQVSISIFVGSKPLENRRIEYLFASLVMCLIFLSYFTWATCM